MWRRGRRSPKFEFTRGFITQCHSDQKSNLQFGGRGGTSPNGKYIRNLNAQNLTSVDEDPMNFNLHDINY